MSAVESFIEKTKNATKARSKEIRITLQEAQILSAELSGMLAKENKLLDKIVKLQDTVLLETAPSSPTGDITMDGGSFKQ